MLLYNGNFIFLLLLQLSTFISAFFIDERHSPNTHQWSYHKQQDWKLEHKQCNLKAQSPIDIQRKFVIPNNQLKLHFYNYNQLTRFKIQNAHHTIKLNPLDNAHNQLNLKFNPLDVDETFNSSLSEIITADEDVESVVVDAKLSNSVNNNTSEVEKSRVIVHHKKNDNNADSKQNNLQPINGNSIGGESESSPPTSSSDAAQMPYNGAPTIKLDWLDDGNNVYKLRDIHFHWAERRDNGSEHAIDGRRAAMEMHLVHTKYGLDVSKIGFTSDSVTVIAILIESYRKSNADFNPIVNALTRINMTNQAQEIEYKSINDLLPNILTSFYTYSGSLTTPPCYQVVNWIVMADRLYMNAKQLEMFRNLYAPDEDSSSSHEATTEPTAIMPNIRQIQPLNNRTILASFAPLGRLEQMPASQRPPLNEGSSWQNQFEGFMMILVALTSFVMSIFPNSRKLT